MSITADFPKVTGEGRAIMGLKKSDEQNKKKKSIFENIKKENLLVNKKLVHKHKDENVLIYNLRRALPRKISADIMEERILPALTEDEKYFLLKYYSNQYFPLISPENRNNTPDYLLKTLPYKLKFEILNRIINIKKLNLSDKKFLLTYYFRDKTKNVFYMKDNIDEEIELKILKMFNLKEWYITSEEKAVLSDILEKINVKEIKNDRIFIGNMFVKIDHSFFFEHPNEHVPAMMTIETSRQFMIALCHKYFSVPYKNVNFILNGMDVNFMSYLDLNYPVKIVGKINDYKIRKGIIIFIDIEVTMWQKCREAVKFNFMGKLITREVFKVLRNDKEQYKIISRFHPRSLFYHNISLRVRGNQKKKYLCDLVDLSDKGFKVKIDKKSPDISQDDSFEFFMHFQETGFIHGNCELIWYELETEHIVAGFKITDISDDDRENLLESIKRFCYVNEEREIL